MTRPITAAFLVVAVLWGGFFVGLTRHLTDETWPDW